MEPNERPEQEPLDSTPMKKDAQVETANRIQSLWLRRMELMLQNGTATSSDLATLERFLRHNGYTVDASRLPKGLRDKLTSQVDPESFEDDEDDQVLPMTGRRPA
jgi:hypothetical protein